METIKISDADARHKELMAGIAGIERALLLINDALRLQAVETGPANTQTDQEKVAAMQWQRKSRREDLAQALHEHGMTDTALRVLKQEQCIFQGGQRVSSTSKFRGGLGTVTRLAEDGKLVAVAFDNGPELWIEACDLELIGGAT